MSAHRDTNSLLGEENKDNKAYNLRLFVDYLLKPEGDLPMGIVQIREVPLDKLGRDFKKPCFKPALTVKVVQEEGGYGVYASSGELKFYPFRKDGRTRENFDTAVKSAMSLLQYQLQGYVDSHKANAHNVRAYRDNTQMFQEYR